MIPRTAVLVGVSAKKKQNVWGAAALNVRHHAQHARYATRLMERASPARRGVWFPVATESAVVERASIREAIRGTVAAAKSAAAAAKSAIKASAGTATGARLATRGDVCRSAAAANSVTKASAETAIESANVVTGPASASQASRLVVRSVMKVAAPLTRCAAPKSYQNGDQRDRVALQIPTAAPLGARWRVADSTKSAVLLGARSRVPRMAKHVSRDKLREEGETVVGQKMNRPPLN
jgi:hypothetical protein